VSRLPPLLQQNSIREHTVDLDLTGRHALVCGASQGIGRARTLETGDAA
jgi:hypothetical protein